MACSDSPSYATLQSLNSFLEDHLDVTGALGTGIPARGPTCNHQGRRHIATRRQLRRQPRPLRPIQHDHRLRGLQVCTPVVLCCSPAFPYTATARERDTFICSFLESSRRAQTVIIYHHLLEASICISVPSTIPFEAWLLDKW